MQRKAKDDAGEADHGAHGKIDAAGQNDEGHADRHNAGDDRLVEQIEKIVGLEEVGREQRQRDRDDDRERQHPQFERRRTKAEASRGAARSGVGSGATAPIGFEVSWVIASRESGLESRSASPPPAGRGCRAGSRRRSIPAHGRDGCGRRPAGSSVRLSDRARSPRSAPSKPPRSASRRIAARRRR